MVIDPAITRFLNDVANEVHRAQKLFPMREHGLAALFEEVGEAAQALIDHNRGDQSAEDVYTELVQSAAMCVRMAVEGDPEFNYVNPHE